MLLVNVRVAQLNGEMLLLMPSEELRRATYRGAASEELGEWNLRDVVVDTAANIKLQIHDLKERTSVPGIITPRFNFLDVTIGSFDF